MIRVMVVATSPVVRAGLSAVVTTNPRLTVVGSARNKAIAKSLHISEHTVKFHLSSIFQKLSVSSRTEAVAVGVRLSLIML